MRSWRTPHRPTPTRWRTRPSARPCRCRTGTPSPRRRTSLRASPSRSGRGATTSGTSPAMS
ncbi:hypothetical protein B5P19_11620 [Clavibacter sepedonicus]|nr:hypothetical protein B5P19_11620 [Clavibacter sepedonicus]OQJ54367.1 hypothetical protein B5P20_09805 [Clavibacter sepedonicus]